LKKEKIYDINNVTKINIERRIKMQKNENNIIIYQDENGITKVTVRFVDEDIWLTQNQIAEIYETTQQNVSLHINNIYKDKELEQNSTHKEFLLVQKEGNRNVDRIYRL